MTLVELVVLICLLGAGLFLLAGMMGDIQRDARRDLAVRMLADLDKALARYHRTTGSYPPSYGPSSAITATIALLDHDRTRPILEVFPSCLWRGPGRRHLMDPWGTILRYYSETSDSPLVRANSGRPLFESAGPDRDFGDTDPACGGDNLRSDDPGPEGFRLHDVLRDSVAREEASGQKDD